MKTIDDGLTSYLLCPQMQSCSTEVAEKPHDCPSPQGRFEELGHTPHAKRLNLQTKCPCEPNFAYEIMPGTDPALPVQRLRVTSDE